jgi:hypothetical protein
VKRGAFKEVKPRGRQLSVGTSTNDSIAISGWMELSPRNATTLRPECRSTAAIIWLCGPQTVHSRISFTTALAIAAATAPLGVLSRSSTRGTRIPPPSCDRCPRRKGRRRINPPARPAFPRQHRPFSGGPSRNSSPTALPALPALTACSTGVNAMTPVSFLAPPNGGAGSPSQAGRRTATHGARQDRRIRETHVKRVRRWTCPQASTARST